MRVTELTLIFQTIYKHQSEKHFPGYSDSLEVWEGQYFLQGFKNVLEIKLQFNEKEYVSSYLFGRLLLCYEEAFSFVSDG